MRARAAACLLALLLGGCNALPPFMAGEPDKQKAPEPPPKPAPVESRNPNEVDALLLYYEGLRKLSGAELDRERERARSQALSTRSAYHRLQVALHGALPAADAMQQTEGMALAEAVIKDRNVSDAELRRFASFLHMSIAENRRLAEGAAASSQKLKEQERRALDLERRAADLEQKLEALKSIDKSLVDRSRAKPKAQ